MVEFLKDLGWLIDHKYLSLLCQLEVIFEDAVFQEVQVLITQGLFKGCKTFWEVVLVSLLLRFVPQDCMKWINMPVIHADTLYLQ